MSLLVWQQDLCETWSEEAHSYHRQDPNARRTDGLTAMKEMKEKCSEVEKWKIDS